VWFAGGDAAVDARFRSEAERVAVGAGDLVVHLHGRGGLAYHAGRPVPLGVLADLLAELPVGFGRVVALVCQAGLGDLVGLPAELADRGRPGTALLVSDGLVGISAASGVAVALTVGYDGSGRLQRWLSAFRQVTAGSGGPSSTAAGTAYPAGVDASTDPGPFALRRLPDPAAPPLERSMARLGRWAVGLGTGGGYQTSRIPSGMWVRPVVLGAPGRAFRAVVGALPAPAAGERLLIVVGVPGMALPDRVVDEVRARLREPVPEGLAAAVLFVRPLSPQQLEWARRRAARGVDIVAPLGEVRADPGGPLWSAAGWQSITTTGAAQPGAVVQRPLGLAYPPLAPPETGLAGIAAAATRAPLGVVLDDPRNPDPVLTELMQPCPGLFTVTAAAHTDGVNYRVGGRVVTVDELASLVSALPESGDLPVALLTDRPLDPHGGQLLADHLQRPVLTQRQPQPEGGQERRWRLYQPRRLGLPTADPVELDVAEPTGAHPLVAAAVARLQAAGDIRQTPLPPETAVRQIPLPPGAAEHRHGRRIALEPRMEPLFETSRESDLLQVLPGPDEVYLYARPVPDTLNEQARPLWDLGGPRPAEAWEMANALPSLPLEEWCGRTLVLVANSYFDGVDRVGQLLANYTGSPVVVATRQVWARGRVLVTASAALLERRSGSLYLGPAAEADGCFLRRQPRRGGLRQPPTVLGATLPTGHPRPAWAGRQVTVLPAPNRTTVAVHAATDVPAVRLSGAAARVWEDSAQTPHGRSFYGQRPRRDDRGLVVDARDTVPPGDAYVVDVHGSPAGFGVAGREVPPEVLAEAVAADPRWTGQPVLLNACNDFDNSDPGAAVFLPLPQLFADALQARAPQWDVAVIGASGIVLSAGDGRSYVASRYDFVLPDGTLEWWRTTEADGWFLVAGRRRGERAPAPQPLGATYASGGREYPAREPAGATPVPVRSTPGPDRRWPVVLGTPLGRADRLAVRLALSPDGYARRLEELRAQGVPEQELRAAQDQLVALRAYEEDPDFYDSEADAGVRDARRVVRAASASYTRTMEMQSGRWWIRPRVLVGAAERAFETAVRGWPGSSTDDRIVGVPGRGVPGVALSAVRRWLDGESPQWWTSTRVLLAGRITPEQRALARRLAANYGVHVAYLDQEAARRDLGDPVTAQSAIDRWIPVTPHLPG
jgi:hypothetical protein